MRLTAFDIIDKGVPTLPRTHHRGFDRPSAKHSKSVLSTLFFSFSLLPDAFFLETFCHITFAFARDLMGKEKKTESKELFTTKPPLPRTHTSTFPRNENANEMNETKTSLISIMYFITSNMSLSCWCWAKAYKPILLALVRISMAIASSAAFCFITWCDIQADTHNEIFLDDSHRRASRKSEADEKQNAANGKRTILWKFVRNCSQKMSSIRKTKSCGGDENSM